MLTYEEISFICVYDTNTRKELIHAITATQEHLETDMVRLSYSVIAKLQEMSDEDFKGLMLIPDFGEE